MNLLHQTGVDLEILKLEGISKLNALERSQGELNISAHDWHIPECVFDLVCLYILSFIKEIDPHLGRRTKARKLKTIASIGTKLCEDLVHELQKKYANLVSSNYYKYFLGMDFETNICGASAKFWGKYVHPDFTRKDVRGTFYSPCIFSMQICLAHLSLKKSKIAVLNDHFSLEGRLKKRFVQILQGTGNGGFKILNSENSMLANREPMIVFGGAVYSNNSSELIFSNFLEQLKSFPNLVLACDLYYPQFPNVSDDPNFNSNPIQPEEDLLIKIFQEHSNIKGVTTDEPSVFCLSHIYTASYRDLALAAQQCFVSLPLSHIPFKKLNLNLKERDNTI